MAIRKPAPSSLYSSIGAQALRGLGAHGPLPRQEQECVRPPSLAPDAAAQLVQLGEPVAVGVAHDDRVRVRDVEAATR